MAKERALSRLLEMVAFLGHRDSCLDAGRLLAAGVDLPQVRRLPQVSGRPR